MGSSQTSPYGGYWRVFEAATRRLAVQPIDSQISQPGEIEAGSIARTETAGGLIVMPDNLPLTHRDFIIGLAERYRVPAIYPYRHYVESGGLISDGIDERMYCDAVRHTSTASSREKSGQFRCNSPQNSSWLSTLEQPERSA